MRGSVLRLFIGNMAAGKTRHLQIEVETLRGYGKKRILVLKPTTAPYDSPQIVVGGDDLYEPRCFDHFETRK